MWHSEHTGEEIDRQTGFVTNHAERRRRAVEKCMPHAYSIFAAVFVGMYNSEPDFRALIFCQAVFWGVIAREGSILEHRGLKNANYNH
jgi:hypothetical protein